MPKFFGRLSEVKLQAKKNISGYSFFLFCSFRLVVNAQSDSAGFLAPLSDSILNEGIELYECAEAAQNPFEFMFKNFHIENVFGQITYKKGNLIHSVFLSGDVKRPTAGYTFTYTLPLNESTMKTDLHPRELSDYEKALVKMKKKIVKLAGKRRPYFANYEGILLNPIFIQKGDFTYAYLLSSSKDTAFIPMGNDYLLIFNEEAKLLCREKKHQNLIEIPLKADSLQSDEAQASFHFHSEFSSPFITATDIAMALLYHDKTQWQSLIVISPGYVSFFFPAQRRLEIITREAYEKMSEEGE